MTLDRQEAVERFRERLLEVIARSGKSRSAFARKIGIDRSTLSQILSPSTDRLPRVETLAAIAATEQVSLDWLVGLSEEGSASADMLPQALEVAPGGRSPSDERLEQWHSEALGYKIRHVPASLPDLLKTADVIEYEYQASSIATPEQRRATSAAGLAYQRRPETDMECCNSVQSVEALARGEGIWRDLPRSMRKEQLDHMIGLLDELYPTFRWFLFDGLHHFSVPLTVFGPLRAVIYMGQMYFVLNGREHIRILTEHFDGLIRAASVQPRDVAAVLDRLAGEL
jgi:transcriptional regulator with XRE-family HTH domain